MDLHDPYTRYAAHVHRFALYLCGDRALAAEIHASGAWTAKTRRQIITHLTYRLGLGPTRANTVSEPREWR